MNHAPTRSLDTGTSLAVERTWLAHERTLMAWVRTATALISFGFTIYKFFEFESGKGAIAAAGSRGMTPRQFGMLMIATGLTALGLASIDHYRRIRKMRVDYGPTGHSVALVVAMILAGMGILALLGALFRG